MSAPARQTTDLDRATGTGEVTEDDAASRAGIGYLALDSLLLLAGVGLILLGAAIGGPALVLMLASHLLLTALSIGAVVTFVIAWFAVISIGRYPRDPLRRRQGQQTGR